MLPVTKIQHFCVKDGPGIRTTVFLKGCPLRCVWCHNPETQSSSKQFFYYDNMCVRCGNCQSVCPQNAHIVTDDGHTVDRSVCIDCMQCADVCYSGAMEKCADFLTEDEIFNRVMKDAAFYGNIGGVTISGGEPTVHLEKIIPLLKRFKENNINTALETCGYFDRTRLCDLVDVTDLFLWDIKDTDDARHLSNTGVHVEKIIGNLRAADALGAKTIMRCILLKSVNMDDGHLTQIAQIFNSLEHCKGVELIEYHTYGASKSVHLGRVDNSHPEWIPSKDDMNHARELLGKYVTLI